MNRFFAALTCAFVLLLSSASFAASFACEGTVRTLVALSNRQIWSNVPYKVEKAIVAADKAEATKSAATIALRAIKDRETTVAVAHARMRCVEIPDKPKDAPNRGIANPDLVKTIGRHWHSKRRFSWGTRYHAEGDMSAKTFDDGSRFEPVRQFVD